MSIRVVVVLGLVVAGACSYGAQFRDCEVGCNAETGCPNGLACGDEGLCRAPGIAQTCEEVLGDAGLPDGNDGGGGGGFVGDDLAYVKASNTAANDAFAVAVAVSADGSTVAVGAAGEDSAGALETDNSKTDAGAVYVYVRAGASWVQQAYVKAAITDANDQFGRSVALSADGNTLAVGTQAEDSAATGVDGDPNNNAATDSGAVYVYVRSGSTWTLQAYLKASNTQSQDLFGRTIALSGDGSTLIAGAVGEDSADPTIDGNNAALEAGAAYVFTRSGTTWSQLAYVKANQPIAGDRFGESVATSADGMRLAIGAPQHQAATIVNAGAVYVFRRSGGAFVQEALLVASTPSPGDQLGQSVALDGDGDTLAAGAPFEDSAATTIGGDETDNSAMDAGAVYVFVRAGTDWSGQAYVKAPNTDAGDQLGGAVALAGDGDTLFAGAILEDSSATRLDGDQTSDAAANSGAAYVLVRAGITWSHRAYVKASNTRADHNFAACLALSGDAGVAAACGPRDASAAIGIDGNQQDTSAPAAGALYVYF